MVSPRLKPNQLTKEPHNGSNSEQKRLYTLKEGAYYLGRSLWSLRELIWAGEVPYVRQGGGRKMYVDKSDLDRYIEKNKLTYI